MCYSTSNKYFDASEKKNRKINGAEKISWVPPNPGGHPTHVISIKFKIPQKFQMLWFKMCSTDHSKILHTSWQLHCHDMYKILL